MVAVAAVYFQKDNTPNLDDTNVTIKQWWAKKRAKYNAGLIIAGFTAFIAYVILSGILIAPFDNNFEVTLFTIVFQGVGYLFMMLIANLFYNLGPLIDRHYNKNNTEEFRERLFNFGFRFSVGLPFLIPISIVVEYFIRFAGHK
jgi:hypothetical protein